MDQQEKNKIEIFIWFWGMWHFREGEWLKKLNYVN